MKNNYEEVKIWNYKTERFKKTGLQFCGLIMSDHSKCGINTMFNTGTVVGVSVNILEVDFLEILYLLSVGEDILDLQLIKQIKHI